MSTSGSNIGLRFYAVFVLLTLAGFGLVEYQVRSLIEQSINVTGEAISQQLAKNTRDHVINREHLVLHAQASALQEMSIVQSVTIYDEDNNILARSPATAESDPDASTLFSFPAPITLNDTLIGNVNVRLNAHHLKREHQRLYNSLLAGLLAGLIFCLLLGNRVANYFVVVFSDIHQGIKKINGGSREEDLPSSKLANLKNLINNELEQLAEKTRKLEESSPLHLFSEKPGQLPTTGYALLLIECLNINQIQRQISPSQARKILQDFQLVVDRSAQLYKGTNIEVQGKYLLLRFANDHHSDTAMRMISCSWLVFSQLIQLQEKSALGTHIKCRMSAIWAEPARLQTALASNLQFEHELEQLQQLCQQGTENDLILAKNFRQFSTLAENCKITLVANHELDEDFYRLEGLEDEIQLKLNRQLDELIGLGNSPE